MGSLEAVLIPPTVDPISDEDEEYREGLRIAEEAKSSFLTEDEARNHAYLLGMFVGTYLPAMAARIRELEETAHYFELADEKLHRLSAEIVGRDAIELRMAEIGERGRTEIERLLLALSNERGAKENLEIETARLAERLEEALARVAELKAWGEQYRRVLELKR